MPLDIVERTEEEIQEIEIIKTKHWELPVDSLEGWKPFSAYIDYRVFLGPNLEGYGRGLSLHKDLMGGIHGARGSGKSEFLSFLLAKKMVSGKPVWTNFPISFYVIEPNDELTYYESMPLDFKKFYAFSPEVRRGAVGITELQYYVEARTSGREQNRIATYQIMQLRKTALSFLYDVQNRAWVDKRFGWSNDFDIEISDVAKMNYDRSDIFSLPPQTKEHGILREGAVCRFTLEDTSGVLTGTSYRKNHRLIGPYQFFGYNIWDIYPTNFIVNAYEAIHSLKKESAKQEARDLIANSLELAINDFLKDGDKDTRVFSSELWEKANQYAGRELDIRACGRQLSEWEVPTFTGRKGKRTYGIGVLLEEKAN